MQAIKACSGISNKTHDDVQVALTRLPYMHLMDALFNSVVLPERTWDSMGMMEQIMLLKRRSAITEPLLEAAGELPL